MQADLPGQLLPTLIQHRVIRVTMVMSAVLVARVVADPYIAPDVITAVCIIQVLIAVHVIITAKWLGVTQEIL